MILLNFAAREIFLKSEVRRVIFFQNFGESSPKKVSKPKVEVEEALKTLLSEVKRGDASLAFAKVDKEDPRSRLHFVKYMKKEGKTIKIWECGICEFSCNEVSLALWHAAIKIMSWASMNFSCLIGYEVTMLLKS